MTTPEVSVTITLERTTALTDVVRIRPAPRSEPPYDDELGTRRPDTVRPAVRTAAHPDAGGQRSRRSPGQPPSSPSVPDQPVTRPRSHQQPAEPVQAGGRTESGA